MDSAHMPDETMTLREVARRLAVIKNPKAKGIDVNKLHNLLRSGQLGAGFYMLDGTVWIDIPVGYWEMTEREKVRQKIIRKEGNSSPGTYRLRPGEFPDQITDVIWEQIRSDTRSNERVALLTSIVRSIGRQYEVTVKTAAYGKYLQRHGVKEQTIKKTSGRYPVEGWRDLCSYMAAYMIAFERAYAGQHQKLDITSKDIVEKARAGGKTYRVGVR